MLRAASVKMIELAKCQLIVALYPVPSGELQREVEQRLTRLKSLVSHQQEPRWIPLQQLENVDSKNPAPAPAVVLTCPGENAQRSLIGMDLTRCKENFKGGFIAGSKMFERRNATEIVICPGFFEGGPEDAAKIRGQLRSAFLRTGPDFELPSIRGACTSSFHGLQALLISPSQLL